MSDKPESPADPRDGEPYYIDSDCPTCGTTLVQDEDAAADGWYDEWKCPQCDDGIHMDWPAGMLAELDERAKDLQE